MTHQRLPELGAAVVWGTNIAFQRITEGCVLVGCKPALRERR